MGTFGNPWGISSGEGIDTTKLYDIPKTEKDVFTECPSDGDWFYMLAEKAWTDNNSILLPLNTYLKAYWKGEDTADSWGSHTLTNVNGVTFTSGKYNGAFSLDGGNDKYVYVADSDDWHFSTGDFTIQLWMKITTYTHGMTFMAQRFDSDNYWSLWYDSTNGITFRQEESNVATINFSQGATTGWGTDVWYHVVLTRVGSAFNIYRDATSIASTTDSDDVANFTANLQLAYPGGLVGLFDEVAIWKGHGMSASEVAALYNSGSGAFLI